MPSRIFIFEVQLIYVGADIEDERHFNLQPLKPITFLSFFLYKTRVCHISRHERCEICSKLTIKTPEYVKFTINKANNKDTVDVILVSLLLDLNIIHFLLQCFYCWLWSVHCRLGSLLVVLTLCGCWNQFRQSFQLWKN